MRAALSHFLQEKLIVRTQFTFKSVKLEWMMILTPWYFLMFEDEDIGRPTVLSKAHQMKVATCCRYMSDLGCWLWLAAPASVEGLGLGLRSFGRLLQTL